MGTEETKTQQAEITTLQKGKVGFGLDQLGKPTPMWVIWIFRTQFVLNKAALMYIGATVDVPLTDVKSIILKLSIIDFVIWGLGRFVGITKEKIETNNQ
jgi:hypothetical protein